MTSRPEQGASTKRRFLSHPWIFDLRFGARLLRRFPLFALAVVMTLALGIGANTAIFSIAYGLLIRPLPYAHPDQIVQLSAASQGNKTEWTVTADELQFLRSQKMPLNALGAYSPATFNATMGGPTEHLSGMYVSYDYLDVLDVHPVMGRQFTAEEDRGEGSRVALIGYRMWQRMAGAEANILGKTLQLDGISYTVIGVLPPNFERVSTFLSQGDNQVWLPLALASKTIGTGQNIGLIGRMPPALSIEKAQLQMDGIRSAFMRRFPSDMPPETSVELVSYRAWLGDQIRTMLLVLFGAAGVVMLVACANVIGLLLSRAEGRKREVAIRMALGADTAQLLRQFIAESLVLCLLGTGTGILLSSLCLKGIIALSPEQLPRIQDIRLDGMALAFSALLGVLAAIIFGVAPAYRLVRVEIQGVLQETQGAGGRSQMRMRRGLVIAQVGLSLVLLVGSALLVQTFRNVSNQDPGVRRESIVAVPIFVTSPSLDAANQSYSAAVSHLLAAGIADKVSVVAAGLPFEQGANIGVKAPASPDRIGAELSMVTPGVVDVLGVPLQGGREFVASDDATSLPVAIVNEKLAGELFPDGNALGHTIQVGVGEPAREIVGVIGNVRSQLDKPPPSAVMLPLAQAKFDLLSLLSGWFPVQVVFHVNSWNPTQATAALDAIKSSSPGVAVGNPRTVEAILSSSLAARRFQVVLLGSFSLLATVLGMIGIYGVMDENVRSRSREIAIRKSVGASARSILILILTSSLRLIAAGLVGGLVASIAFTRLLQSYLFDVSATDPKVFAAMALCLLAAAFLAALVPATRAARLDPMPVLRRE
ncbi:putative ABC transport system permease protein [Luteibacter sp. HA06]